MIVALLVAGWITAVNRGDRGGRISAVLGALGLIAGVCHCLMAPPSRYFLPLWPIAMFISLMIGVALGPTLLRGPLRTLYPLVMMTVLVALTVNNLTEFDVPNQTAGNIRDTRTSRELNAALIPQLKDSGVIRFTRPKESVVSFAAALVVALDDANVPYCPDTIVQFLGHPNASCTGHRPGLTIT